MVIVQDIHDVHSQQIMYSTASACEVSLFCNLKTKVLSSSQDEVDYKNACSMFASKEVLISVGQSLVRFLRNWTRCLYLGYLQVPVDSWKILNGLGQVIVWTSTGYCVN